MKLPWLVLAVAFAALPASKAQDPPPPLKPFLSDEPVPIRRAEPIQRNAPPIKQGTKVRKALPVGGGGKKSEENPAAPSQEPVPPVPVPPGDGQPTVVEKPAVPAGSVEMQDPAGDIRLAPSGAMRPDQAQRILADAYYTRKDFGSASTEYEKHLRLYPKSEDRQLVLYRLGESYRGVGAVNAAKSAYERLLSEVATGELVGPAAYRLAEQFYQEKNYALALPLFQKAAAHLRDPQLANVAKFFRARSLEAMSQKGEARRAYEELVQSGKDNPYYEPGKMALALLLHDAAKVSDAVGHVQSLSKESANSEIKAEATVRLGLWELEQRHLPEAEEALNRALKLPELGPWKEVAQSGLADLLFQQQKYEAVVAATADADQITGAETRVQVLKLRALALRELGRPDEAVALFDRVARELPDSAIGREAAYERLVVLYASNAPDILQQIDAYLAERQGGLKRDQVLLMKAETLYKQQKFAEAEPLYGEVAKSVNLNRSWRAQALLKLGWCATQTQNYAGAIQAYTAFIDSFPQEEGMAGAFTQRAVAKMRKGELGAALRDFDEVIKRYPKASEREFALHQEARLQGQLKDNRGMAESFGKLLKEYPNSPAAAEANYWVGWVAFDNKDYKGAREPLSAARTLDPEQYFERASLRILLACYHLEQREALGREIEMYEKGGDKRPAPYDVLEWLGQGYYEAAMKETTPEKRASGFRDAAKYLAMLSQRADAKPHDFLNLGRSRIQIGDYAGAVAPLEKYLQSTKEPAPSATALLSLGEALLGMKDLDRAWEIPEKVFALQPDGRLNARARILVGDVECQRGRLAEACKVYESVALVIDDEQLTPLALEKAVETYKALGRDDEARKVLNRLQSRYPEYLQRRTP